MASNGAIRSGAKKAEQAEKRKRALALREANLSYEEIAQAMGWKHRETARRFVERALKATYQEPADEVRRLELRRLDRLARDWWPLAIARKDKKTGEELPPDPEALDRLMKLMDRRAKLLGLDLAQPRQVNVNLARKSNGELDAALYALGYDHVDGRRIADRNGEAESEGVRGDSE